MYGIIETELSQMSKGLSIMGGFVVIYGLISFFVKERMYLSEPLLCLLYTSPSPRDRTRSRMPSSA